jgi:WD40 repeat protein
VRGHTDIVNSVVFSNDGKYLASGSHDKTLKLWSVQTLTEVMTLRGCSQSFASVAFSPDSNYLASGSNEEVNVWSIE